MIPLPERKRPMNELRVEDPDQRKVLASPLRIELLERLMGEGPASVAELAGRLGRETSSLYYHIRLLREAGLIALTEHRGHGPSEEAVYAAAADHVTVVCNVDSEESIKAEEQGVGALLRLAQREYGKAMRRGEVRPEGGDRNLFAQRIRTNLDTQGIVELNRRVEELLEFLRTERDRGRGTPITLTLVASPLPD
jgi:DNA-binding transcriptional ArsR family regulator